MSVEGNEAIYLFQLTLFWDQTVFVSAYLFDVGLYFPKASLIAFYWWLIPQGFRLMRIAVYVCTAALAGAAVGTFLTITLIAPNFSDNWYGRSV